MHLTAPLVASQVNITLLDINDNHPTWKDAPYYINLVEMTPPDSDVTTVRGGGTAELPVCPAQGCPPFRHELCGPAMGLMDSCFLCASSWSEVPGALCTVKGSERSGDSPHPVLGDMGLQTLSKGVQHPRAGSAGSHACPESPGLW